MAAKNWSECITLPPAISTRVTNSDQLITLANSTEPQVWSEPPTSDQLLHLLQPRGGPKPAFSGYCTGLTVIQTIACASLLCALITLGANLSVSNVFRICALCFRPLSTAFYLFSSSLQQGTNLRIIKTSLHTFHKIFHRESK